MPLINLSVKHGRTLEEARAQLESTVRQVEANFGAMLNQVAWSPDRSGVKILGPGLEIEMQVDAAEVHLTADMPILGKLLGSRFATGLKQLVERNFQKKLT
jgi:hypothetical protein